MAEFPRNLPHLYLRGRGKPEPYTTKLRPRNPALPLRNRAAHAEGLTSAMNAALAAALAQRLERDSALSLTRPGFYLDFELAAKSEQCAEKLEYEYPSKDMAKDILGGHPKPANEGHLKTGQ